MQADGARERQENNIAGLAVQMSHDECLQPKQKSSTSKPTQHEQCFSFFKHSRLTCAGVTTYRHTHQAVETTLAGNLLMVPGQSELDRQIEEGAGGRGSGVGGQDGDQGDCCTHQEGGLLRNQSLHQEEPLLHSGSSNHRRTIHQNILETKCIMGNTTAGICCIFKNKFG